MREWLRYFRIWFIVCGVLLAAILVGYFSINKPEEDVPYERINNVCTETERVFDFADVLTDKEEDDLRAIIAETELSSGCDIILVVMNESLEEYAKSYFPDAYGSDWAMIKADNFYDENGFGWNKFEEASNGDGILLLDNWYRESDGKVHTWLSTSGKVEHNFSEAHINLVLDAVYAYDIEAEPYKAYRAYVETFGRIMNSGIVGSVEPVVEIPWYAIIIGPFIVAFIFVLLNMSGKEGKKTITAETYLGGGKRPVFKVREDRFIRKTVTKRKIDRDSGGGGGSRSSGGGAGHHTSSSGHSHGGGGRSR